MRNINKTISQIMIELNRSIFHDDKKKITKNMKIENWIKHKNKIYFYEKALNQFDEFFQIMTFKKLIIVIMKNVKNERVIDDDKFSIACCKKLHYYVSARTQDVNINYHSLFNQLSFVDQQILITLSTKSDCSTICFWLISDWSLIE